MADDGALVAALAEALAEAVDALNDDCALEVADHGDAWELRAPCWSAPHVESSAHIKRPIRCVFRVMRAA